MVSRLLGYTSHAITNGLGNARSRFGKVVSASVWRQAKHARQARQGRLYSHNSQVDQGGVVANSANRVNKGGKRSGRAARWGATGGFGLASILGTSSSSTIGASPIQQAQAVAIGNSVQRSMSTGGVNMNSVFENSKKAIKTVASVAAPIIITSSMVAGNVFRGVMTSAGVILGMNLLGFAITATTRTHLITDLVGTGAFAASAVITWMVGKSQGGPALRPTLMTICATIWSVRLAGYLFYRILKTKNDNRLAAFFPESHDEPWTASKLSKLGMFWGLQSLWGFIVLLPVTIVNSLPRAWHAQHRVGPMAFIGLAIWSCGFVMECIADYEKDRFRADPANNNRFIRHGVYSLCRYPNYAGEICLWYGVYLLGWPAVTSSFGWYAILSPLFTTVLLRFVSGVPLLERRYDSIYKDNAEYQEYKRNTNMLIPSLKNWKALDDHDPRGGYTTINGNKEPESSGTQ
eukprot:CAMPEP_0184693816 /NCGR_PEP_ID=MMETSP0313-20130426/1966_1 /TAXON_ID=2792 /ORGANISM="Porphyridium aerugineum, Strain SAG 1380-2" /LENGTH=461 /DNA_ID=CAMNT_0027151989 /DNA_START=90 /DNA_END=1475 /DNA_ORIENTATION=+